MHFSLEFNTSKHFSRFKSILLLIIYIRAKERLCSDTHKRRCILDFSTKCIENYFQKYSALFTKQTETPINTGGVGGEEWWCTLHHSSLIVRLSYFFFLGLVIIYVRGWSSFMLRLGHHLCQGLVIIGDGTFACLIFFFPKMVWVKSCEEW